MNSLLSAIKAFVLKNRPAYKDDLGNGKYDVKKLPEECVPDSVNNKIRSAQSTANDAQRTANDAQYTANDAQRTANYAFSTATGTAAQINDVTTFVTSFASLEATKNKERHNFAENIYGNGTSALPLAEAKAPMKCYFDIMLNDSSNHNIKHYAAFEGKIVREVTKISDTYCLFIDESVEVVNDCFAKLKIGYKFSNDDNLWHKFIRAEVTLPDADYNNTSITTIILNARGVIPDTYDYAPWPSICVPLAGTNDAGVVYASDKTDDQTVPVSIDKNGYLWCKGSETLPTDGNPGDILVKTETGSEWQKQKPATTTPDYNQNDPTASDYIKNRPFYTGEQIFTEIIPEQTYTLSSIDRGFTAYVDSSGTYPYSLEEGKDYTVVYNGATYELTSENYSGHIYVGDIGPLISQEMTLPFAIVASSGILQIVDYIGNTEVTLKISANVQEIKQIDTKYIPELPKYMSKVNPVCNGSFSLNRKADTTIGEKSHTEGNETTASATGSHAEGSGTTASGSYSHAEGNGATAYGHFSHAEGYYTKASGDYSHVQGKYNIDDSDQKYANIVGNGTSDTVRSNAHTLDWEGNAWYAGTVEGTAMIVKSSTANSTKKFKITVDDTGTISATEVT